MTIPSADPLPPPPPEAVALSDRLLARIREEIDTAGGWLPFERYMELALYEPGLGYYSAGSIKFGALGDFVTAPEISSLFGAVLANVLATRLAALPTPVILELGAGSGALAQALLMTLEADHAMRPDYWILEPSADLRERQQRALARHGSQLRWLETLPQSSFDGIVLANEVADALPVAVFAKRREGVDPLGVALDGTALCWSAGPPDLALESAVLGLETQLGTPFASGYRSEICPRLGAWLEALAASLRTGSIVLIDYGLPRHEYYHPTRASGTLVCHYRHRAHGDPFFYPGLQDLSAWVDFSALAQAGRNAGLTVDGFTTQAQFLLHAGATEALARLDEADRLRESQALKRLLLPGEMGERFKVLTMSRGLEATLPGRDFRDRL